MCIVQFYLQVNPDHVIAATVASNAFDGDFLVVPSYCEGFKQVGSPRFDFRKINVGTITNENFSVQSVEHDCMVIVLATLG